MVEDLIDAISEATVRRASQKVLFASSLPLKALSNKEEISVFDRQIPFKGQVGILAILTSSQPIQMDEVLSNIIANLILSCVIDSDEQVMETYQRQQAGINENIELFVYSLDEVPKAQTNS